MASKADGSVKVGDAVVVSGHQVGQPGRVGEIIEVLGEAAHPHFRVHWEDGTESIFYPSSDATVRPLRPRRSRSEGS
jgi:hypothetical protein